MLGLAFLAVACGPHYLGLTDDGGPVIFEKDSSEWLDKDKDKDQQGVHFEITDFTWRYVPHTGHIEVKGRARNMTGKLAQGVRIMAETFDQFDKSLGTSETYVMPSMIAPDKIGTFRFFLNGGEWVKAVHIRYQFASRVE